MEIRDARATDVAQIAGLFVQLGYPATQQELARRWAAAPPAGDVVALVADDGAGVRGVLVLHYLAPLHVAQPWALLSALIVDGAARGLGVGAALLTRAEQLAVARGCSRMELSSNQQRVDAHHFYAAHGYVERRKRLLKALASAPLP